MQRLCAMSPIQNLVDGYSDFCAVSSTIGKNKLPITPNITIVFFICTIRVGKNASSIAVLDTHDIDFEREYVPCDGHCNRPTKKECAKKNVSSLYGGNV